jgi:exodeoxyribonuclease V gamma subunit
MPPSVVVSELLDYVAYDLEEPKPAKRLTVRHRLQAFSPAYFSGGGPLFGSSGENLEAARLMRSERVKPGNFIPNPLPEPEEEWRTVDLETLCRFYAAPVRFLIERRLGLRLEPPAESRGETEPFDVDALEKYILRNFLVKRALEGRDLEAMRPAVKAGGSLPPGALGDCHYEDLSRASADFAQRIGLLFAEPAVEPVVVDLELGGFRLTGRIGNLRAGGYADYRYAVIKGKDLLRLWIHHLALNCSAPTGAPPVSRLAGLDDKRNPIAAALDPAADAEEILLGLLELYYEGLRRPLPLFPATSFEYADCVARRNKTPEEGLAAAQKVWESTRFHRGESEDEYLQLAYPGETPLGEEFERLSLAVFRPLLGRLEKANL